MENLSSEAIEPALSYGMPYTEMGLRNDEWFDKMSKRGVCWDKSWVFFVAVVCREKQMWDELMTYSLLLSLCTSHLKEFITFAWLLIVSFNLAFSFNAAQICRCWTLNVWTLISFASFFRCFDAACVCVCFSIILPSAQWPEESPIYYRALWFF